MPKVTRPDASLHVDVLGTGSPVLLVQGVGVEGRGYAPQLADLSRIHTCVTFDHRGIGASRADPRTVTVPAMADDVLAIADELGFGRFHLVGHSLGGVVAQCVALRAPSRVRSLVLQCTFAGGRDLRVPSARLAWLGLRSKVGTAAMRRTAFARLVYPDAYLERVGLERAIATLTAAFGRDLAEAPAIADVQLAALRAHDERDRLGELAAIPCLVQAGAHDPIARPEFARELARRIGGATLEIDPDASHALPIQCADAVNARWLAHFADAEAREVGTPA